MDKVQAVWGGWPGAPGYSNFYFLGDSIGADLNAITGAVRAFFASFTLGLPTPISIQVSPVVQQIDPVTGFLQTEKTASVTPAVIAGAGGANFSSPVGACVVWRTSATHAGHLIKGKTFIVPMATGAYDTDGTLLASRLAELRTAGSTLAAFTNSAGSGLGVWTRPISHAGGGIADVSSATVNDRSAILRTRRV